MKKENWLIILLGLATATTIIIEVVVIDQNSTKIETSLFGIIQFMFSLAFAWYLSKRSSQEEFEKQQRKFAIAAFRRIKEIESQIQRLIGRLNKSMLGDSDNYYHGLDVAKTLAQSLNETTMSSKLDWADVIGDQIETLEKLENIQGDISSSYENEKGRDDNYEKYINELKNSLSSELKLYSSERINKTDRGYFENILEKHGSITLDGFIDPDWKGVREPEKLEIGERLVVRISDQGTRIATLTAYDCEGNYVGSFVKNSPGSYSDFTRAVCQSLGASQFEAEVVDIETRKENSKRFRFKVKAEAKNA